MKVLVIGSDGQLGLEFQKISNSYDSLSWVFSTIKTLDLLKLDTISSFLNDINPSVIINCAAYTSVDKAETESKFADLINNGAVDIISRWTSFNQKKLIHISTDYVFDGKQYRPYIETDIVEPLGVYGQTKLSGEKAIQKILINNAIIIRTGWVYSEYGNNFVKAMLKLGHECDSLNVIFDQVGSPTYARDLARAIISIIQSQSFFQVDFTTSVVHYSNEGVCSWYDFAKTIFEFANVKCKVNAIETKDYPTPAKRPHYAVLNKAKIKQTYNLDIPYWKDSLSRCVTALQCRGS